MCHSHAHFSHYISLLCFYLHTHLSSQHNLVAKNPLNTYIPTFVHMPWHESISVWHYFGFCAT
jgi:hypothetical protein